MHHLINPLMNTRSLGTIRSTTRTTAISQNQRSTSSRLHRRPYSGNNGSPMPTEQTTPGRIVSAKQVAMWKSINKGKQPSNSYAGQQLQLQQLQSQPPLPLQSQSQLQPQVPQSEPPLPPKLHVQSEHFAPPSPEIYAPPQQHYAPPPPGDPPSLRVIHILFGITDDCDDDTTNTFSQ